MKLSLWQFGGLFVVTTLLVSVTLVLLSPDRLIDESITGDFLLTETTNALDLDAKIYLLQPNVRLRASLDSLDWLESYTIERTLPNQVAIVYQALKPIACSQASLHYQVSQFNRSRSNEVLCDSAIQLNGALETTMLEALVSTPVETRNFIERIEFQDQEALVTMKNGQQAIVYSNDFRVLQSIAQLAPTGTVLDLRRNYA